MTITVNFQHTWKSLTLKLETILSTAALALDRLGSSLPMPVNIIWLAPTIFLSRLALAS